MNVPLVLRKTALFCFCLTALLCVCSSFSETYVFNLANSSLTGDAEYKSETGIVQLKNPLKYNDNFETATLGQNLDARGWSVPITGQISNDTVQGNVMYCSLPWGNNSTYYPKTWSSDVWSNYTYRCKIRFIGWTSTGHASYHYIRYDTQANSLYRLEIYPKNNGSYHYRLLSRPPAYAVLCQGKLDTASWDSSSWSIISWKIRGDSSTGIYHNVSINTSPATSSYFYTFIDTTIIITDTYTKGSIGIQPQGANAWSLQMSYDDFEVYVEETGVFITENFSLQYTPEKWISLSLNENLQGNTALYYYSIDDGQNWVLLGPYAGPFDLTAVVTSTKQIKFKVEFNNINDHTKNPFFSQFSLNYSYGVNSPAKITDLTAKRGINSGEIDLSWTAPYDDTFNDSYIIRYSASAITSTQDFDNTSDLPNKSEIPTPASAGIFQVITAKNLEPGTTFYFSIRTIDHSGNYSDVSNCASAIANYAQNSVVSVTFDSSKGTRISLADDDNVQGNEPALFIPKDAVKVSGRAELIKLNPDGPVPQNPDKPSPSEGLTSQQKEGIAKNKKLGELISLYWTAVMKEDDLSVLASSDYQGKLMLYFPITKKRTLVYGKEIFKVAVWENSEWKEVATVVLANNTVMAVVDHLSTYGLFSYVELKEVDNLLVEPNIITPNSDGINDKIYFYLPTNLNLQNLSIQVYDLEGRKTRFIDATKLDKNRTEWDGKDENSMIAESGVYIYKASADNKTWTGTLTVSK